MDISVRLGSGLSQIAGRARLSITLPEEANIADMIAALRSQHPALSSRLEAALPVISGRQVAVSEPLVQGQEVALLLPVSGGSA